MASAADPLRAREEARPVNRWSWTMACGAVLLLAGIFCLAAPGFTVAALAVLIAWVLLFSGIAGVAMGLRSHGEHRRWSDILYGAASIIVGVLVLIDPTAGAASLTLAFAVWLAFRGAVDFGAARTAGPGPLRGLLLLLGVVNWVFAAMLVMNFPFPAVQMLGVFVGVSLVLGGAAAMFAAWQLRPVALG